MSPRESHRQDKRIGKNANAEWGHKSGAIRHDPLRLLLNGPCLLLRRGKLRNTHENTEVRENASQRSSLGGEGSEKKGELDKQGHKMGLIRHPARDRAI